VNLPKLSFPEYSFKLQTLPAGGQSLKIFDIIRRKFVNLTPEEWVRQHLLHYLVNERKFPSSLLSVEKKLMVNRLLKRTDVVAYTSSLKPVMLAECKAPSVKLDQQVFDQAARYNFSLGLDYYLITNGLEIICCRVDRVNQSYQFLETVPDYSTLL
jgi:hypothetical protein